MLLTAGSSGPTLTGEEGEEGEEEGAETKGISEGLYSEFGQEQNYKSSLRFPVCKSHLVARLTVGGRGGEGATGSHEFHIWQLTLHPGYARVWWRVNVTGNCNYIEKYLQISTCYVILYKHATTD